MKIAIINAPQESPIPENALSLQVAPDDQTPKQLKQSLEKACKAKWESLPDIWHIHNHSLNPHLVLPLVIARWAKEGQKLLLHIHPFAEDGHPKNYMLLFRGLASKNRSVFDRIIYPTGNHINYVVSNNRDHTLLLNAGVSKTQCHLLPFYSSSYPYSFSSSFLPSPIHHSPLPIHPSPPPAYLCTSNENIGEAILWAALGQPNEHFYIPTGIAKPQLGTSVDWQTFATQHQLPVHFTHPPEGTPITHLTTCTSSNTLAPFLNYRTAGRDLPIITQPLRDQGVQLHNLYTRIDVPISWIGNKTLLDYMHKQSLKLYQSYRLRCFKKYINAAQSAAIQDDTVDFGQLSDDMQRTVIETLIKHPKLRRQITPEKLSIPLPESLLQTNSKHIAKNYSQEAHDKKLNQIYQQLATSNSETPGYLDTEKLLIAFLKK